MENVYEKLDCLENFNKVEKKNKNNNQLPKLSELDFMFKCRQHMDKYYVGQEVLKKKLCSILAQWKFYGERSTMLMMGPFGCGKNYIIETIAAFPQLEMPVISYDCSSLTPNGFSGADVSGIFRKVKEVMRRGSVLSWRSEGNFLSDNDKCIVYLDEVDKIINWNYNAQDENVNAI